MAAKPFVCRLSSDFEGKEVFIRRDPRSGDVILSRKPDNWDSFLEAIKGVEVPEDVFGTKDRKDKRLDRDPFEGWQE